MNAANPPTGKVNAAFVNFCIRQPCPHLQPRACWFQAAHNPCDTTDNVTGRTYRGLQKQLAAAAAATMVLMLHPPSAATQVSTCAQAGSCHNSKSTVYLQITCTGYACTTMQVVQAGPHEYGCELSASSNAASGPSFRVNEQAAVAGLFGLPDPADEGDTAGPFAIQGQTRCNARMS